MNKIMVNGILVKGDTVRQCDLRYNGKQVYTLTVTRKSDRVDHLLVLSPDENLPEGPVCIKGNLHAEYIHYLNSVPVVIFPDLVKPDRSNGYSETELTGIVKAKPKARMTKSGLAITSVLLNTEDGPVPILLWGKNATDAEEMLEAGDVIKVMGRLQSREYPDKKKNNRTTYELSARKFEIIS